MKNASNHKPNGEALFIDSCSGSALLSVKHRQPSEIAWHPVLWRPLVFASESAVRKTFRRQLPPAHWSLGMSWERAERGTELWRKGCCRLWEQAATGPMIWEKCTVAPLLLAHAQVSALYIGLLNLAEVEMVCESLYCCLHTAYDCVGELLAVWSTNLSFNLVGSRYWLKIFCECWRHGQG